VSAGDANGLAHALAVALTNGEVRTRFRTAGRHTVETKFGFATRMKRLAELYDAMLGSEWAAR
jgi:glycosyltransferase involved in cell wall biosynthesis